ncbi:MAG: hypothetical protein CM15mV74_260 [uncultured marine virus]|nr:MAG: hypothetical protein CM15mV74_260 [uncultured marine virus]
MVTGVGGHCSMAAGQYLWKFSADNWTYQELPVGVAESPVLFSMSLDVNRPLNVQGPMALPPFVGRGLPAELSQAVQPGQSTGTLGQLRSELQHSRVSRLDLTETEVMVVIVPDNYPGDGVVAGRCDQR